MDVDTIASRPGVFLSVDNSNVFIEGQRQSAKRKGLIFAADHQWRYDAGKLVDLVLAGRGKACVRFYGSKALDSCWTTSVYSGQIDVLDLTQRASSSSREAEVDMKIGKDLMRDAERLRTKKEYGADPEGICDLRSYTIVGGDRDLRPVVRDLLDMGFPVQLVTWQLAMSKKYVAFLPPGELHHFPGYDAKRSEWDSRWGDRFRILLLDDIEEDFTFREQLFTAKRDRLRDFPVLAFLGVDHAVTAQKVVSVYDKFQKRGYAFDVLCEGSVVLVVLDKRCSSEEVEEAFGLARNCIPAHQVLSLMEWEEWRKGRFAGSAEDAFQPWDPFLGTDSKGRGGEKSERKDKPHKKEQQLAEKEGAGAGAFKSVSDSKSSAAYAKKAQQEAARDTQWCRRREFCCKEFPRNGRKTCHYKHDESCLFDKNNGKTPFSHRNGYHLNTLCKKHECSRQDVTCRWWHPDQPVFCYNCLMFTDSTDQHPRGPFCEFYCGHCDGTERYDRELMEPSKEAREYCQARTGACSHRRKDTSRPCGPCLFGCKPRGCRCGWC